jgi:sRNA-binding protein
VKEDPRTARECKVRGKYCERERRETGREREERKRRREEKRTNRERSTERCGSNRPPASSAHHKTAVSEVKSKKDGEGTDVNALSKGKSLRDGVDDVAHAASGSGWGVEETVHEPAALSDCR